MNLNSFYDKKKLYIIIIIMIALFIFSLYNYQSLLVITTSMVMSVIGIYFANLVDDKILKVDTKVEIIDNRNVAYAITFFGYCFIIGCSILASVIIYVTMAIALKS